LARHWQGGERGGMVGGKSSKGISQNPPQSSSKCG